MLPGGFGGSKNGSLCNDCSTAFQKISKKRRCQSHSGVGLTANHGLELLGFLIDLNDPEGVAALVTLDLL